jgi:hypothetical protein
VSGHKFDSEPAVIRTVHAIGVAAHVWAIWPTVWTIQIVAGWHGYTWSFGAVFGYLVLLSVLMCTPSDLTVSDRISDMHRRDFGAYKAALSNTSGFNVKAVLITIAWLVVRAL